MLEINKILKKLGYINKIILENNYLIENEKNIKLDFNSLFFVDGGYIIGEKYYFLISAPFYEIKALLILNKNEYNDLSKSEYFSKFNIKIEKESKEIIIKRQYGMRKILKNEFDKNKFILRKNFPDFPKCPYGNNFKMLGYDLEDKEYVRLASNILKNNLIKIEKYGE